MTDLSLYELAVLCHQAENADDDVTFMEVQDEIQRRSAADTVVSPYTGNTYPRGEVDREFRRLYLELWQTKFRPERCEK